MNAYSIEAIQAHAAKRREVNAKFRLLQDAGFKYEGNRFKHPSGKIIMTQVYNKMNYAGLVQRLKDLGFKVGETA